MWLIIRSVILIGLVIFEIKSRKLALFPAFVLLVLLVISPAFTQSSINPQKTLLLVILSLLWTIYIPITYKGLKLLILSLILVLAVFSALFFNSIISQDLHFDRERTFISDSHFPAVISRFRIWSVYLPYRLRPLVFGNWIIAVATLGRTFSWLWLDKAVVAIGFIGLIPLALGAYKSVKQNKLAPLLVICFTVAAGSLARNPDTSVIYFLVLPQLIYLMALGL